MVTEIIGDIFEEFETYRVNTIVHQANCFHTMGGGIARIISQKYPEAVLADDKTPNGDIKKLGTFSIALIPGDSKRFIVNAYSQFDTSAGIHLDENTMTPMEKFMFKSRRATRYDAVQSALARLEKNIVNTGAEDSVKIGIPYGYGSDLAGGSWTIVRAIIESVFAKSPISVTIVRLPDKPDLE